MTHFLAKLSCLAIALAATVSPVAAQETRVNQYTASDEGFARIALDPRGQLRCAWQTSQEFCVGNDIAMRSMDLAGAFLSPDTQVSTACNAGAPLDIAVLSTGAFLVVGRGGDVYAWAYDAGGAFLGEATVNQNTAGIQMDPQVAALANGNYAVVWDSSLTNKSSGRIVMADGSMPFPEQAIGDDQTTDSLYPAVAPSASGGAIVVWQSTAVSPPGPIEIHARLFDSSFMPLSGELVVNQQAVAPSGGIRADVALVSSGYVVAWTQVTNGQGDVKARLLDVNAVPIAGEFVANSYTSLDQGVPHCGAAGNGGFVIAWSSTLQDGSAAAAVARRFDAQAIPMGPDFVVNGSTYDTQGIDDILVFPNGDFLPLWVSYQDTNGTTSVFMRRYAFPMSLALSPGAGAGNAPSVITTQPDGGTAGGASVMAYGTTGYGATVGAGDVDGDGFAEILTGPGPSPVYGPHVKAYRKDGTFMSKVSFYAYGTLKYGVWPAGGSIDTDPFAEILTGAGPGAVFGPHVRGWDFDGGPLRAIGKVSYFAYSTLKYGARVSAGDVDGDGMREILTAPGPGAAFGSQVRGWQYDGVQVASIGKINFLAFASTRYGASVGSADVENDGIGGYGDGFDEILVGVGPDPGHTGDVALFDFDNTSVTQKFQIQPYATVYGANVAGGDIDAGDTDEVITAPGPDPAAPAHVLSWEWDPVIGQNPYGPALHLIGPDDFTAFAGMTYGANVAVGKFE